MVSPMSFSAGLPQSGGSSSLVNSLIGSPVGSSQSPLASLGLQTGFNPSIFGAPVGSQPTAASAVSGGQQAAASPLGLSAAGLTNLASPNVLAGMVTNATQSLTGGAGQSLPGAAGQSALGATGLASTGLAGSPATQASAAKPATATPQTASSVLNAGIPAAQQDSNSMQMMAQVAQMMVMMVMAMMQMMQGNSPAASSAGQAAAAPAAAAKPAGVTNAGTLGGAAPATVTNKSTGQAGSQLQNSLDAIARDPEGAKLMAAAKAKGVTIEVGDPAAAGSKDATGLGGSMDQVSQCNCPACQQASADGGTVVNGVTLSGGPSGQTKIIVRDPSNIKTIAHELVHAVSTGDGNSKSEEGIADVVGSGIANRLGGGAVGGLSGSDQQIFINKQQFYPGLNQNNNIRQTLAGIGINTDV